MFSIAAAKFIAYATCVFLTPFWLKAYFQPLSPLSIRSIGLEPSAEDRVTGLSNIRGSIGGLRLAIIVMSFVGVYFGRPDLCLGAAILVGAISLGRFISLPFDGWNGLSFFTASSEVLIAASLLHVGGFI